MYSAQVGAMPTEQSSALLHVDQSPQTADPTPTPLYPLHRLVARVPLLVESCATPSANIMATSSEVTVCRNRYLMMRSNGRRFGHRAPRLVAPPQSHRLHDPAQLEPRARAAYYIAFRPCLWSRPPRLLLSMLLPCTRRPTTQDISLSALSLLPSSLCGRSWAVVRAVHGR